MEILKSSIQYNIYIIFSVGIFFLSSLTWRVLSYYSNSLQLLLFPEVLICRRRHKSDCLCAICVLKRRRKEREENARLAKGLVGASDNNYPLDNKQEVQ